MIGTNVFGPHISGPNFVFTMRTTQHDMQLFFVDMGPNSSPTLDLIIALKTTEIHGFVMK